MESTDLRKKIIMTKISFLTYFRPKTQFFTKFYQIKLEGASNMTRGNYREGKTVILLKIQLLKIRPLHHPPLKHSFVLERKVKQRRNIRRQMEPNA